MRSDRRFVGGWQQVAKQRGGGGGAGRPKKTIAVSTVKWARQGYTLSFKVSIQKEVLLEFTFSHLGRIAKHGHALPYRIAKS